MRHFIFAFLVCLPFGAAADEPVWIPLTGEDIRAALTGRVLSYGENWQDFRDSGRTLYFSGAESWGYWRVQGDQYCSQWPPSDLWACYKMERRGDILRFVGERDDTIDARYRD